VIILDDLQALAGSAALASLDELIRHLPTGLGLVLVARSAPELGLARLRVAGELADVGGPELACTAEEAGAYFDLLDSPLSAPAREQAFRHSEGWMAGLRLTGLAAEAFPEPGVAPAAEAGAAASRTVAGAQALAAGYLQDEMLDALPPEHRAFLLRTCLTETVPVGLAEELTGGAAAGILEQLSRDHGLVQPTGPDQAEYRYHPMLAEALRAAVRRELPAEVPELERRVSGWHAARGEVKEAVRAAAAVADWDLGASVLRTAGPPVALSPAAAEIESVLAEFPADRLAGDPALAAALAAARLWQGDADGALPHLEWAELALSGQHTTEGDSLALWTAALRVLYRAGLGEAGGGTLAREWSLARQAHESPTGIPAHQALGVLWLALGFAALRDVDVPQARSAMLHAGSQLSAAGLLSLRERARSWEAVASALHGDLAAATRIAGTVSDGPHGADAELSPVLALAAAQVSLARDELEAAAGQLDEAELAVLAQRPAGEPSIAVVSGLLRARLAMADGNLAGARGLARWLTELVAGSSRLAVATAGQDGPAAGGALGLTGAAQAVAALDAEISLAAGEPGRAQATLAAAGLTEPDLQVRPAVAICRAKLLIAGEDDKGALRQLEPLLAEAGAGGTLLDQVAALLTAVIAHRRLSQGTDAAALLEEALALAEPDDACGLFVAAGSAARSALTVLIPPSSRCAAFAARILDRFDGRQQRPGSAQPGSPLTDSELAVLRFLPSHMTNQEIAQALFLSINTIKTHLSSVYRKLGVVNRRQAIAQGRKLDLLLGGSRLPARRHAGDRLGCPAQCERQAGQHQAVEDQPGADNAEQQDQGDARPDDHDQPGGDTEHAEDGPRTAARGGHRRRDADVADAVHDEVDAHQERQQQQAQRVMLEAVDTGDHGEQAEEHIGRSHARSVAVRREPLEQPDQPRHHQSGSDEDGHDREGHARPGEQCDPYRDHAEAAEQQGYPGPVSGAGECTHRTVRLAGARLRGHARLCWRGLPGTAAELPRHAHPATGRACLCRDEAGAGAVGSGSGSGSGAWITGAPGAGVVAGTAGSVVVAGGTAVGGSRFGHRPSQGRGPRVVASSSARRVPAIITRAG
jgi:LuxR family maltose regulon positive regulatory protein